jgi:hypothetical protein
MKPWDRAPCTAITLSLPFAYIAGKFLLTTAQYDGRHLADELLGRRPHHVLRHQPSFQARRSGRRLPGRRPLRPDPRPSDASLLAGTIQPHRDNGIAGQVSIANG